MSDRFFLYRFDLRWTALFRNHSALWVSVADPEGPANAIG